MAGTAAAPLQQQSGTVIAATHNEAQPPMISEAEMVAEGRIQQGTSLQRGDSGAVHEAAPAMAAADMVSEILLRQEDPPLQGDVVEALLPLKEEIVDLENIEKQARRRSSKMILQIDAAELEDDGQDEDEWNKEIKEGSSSLDGDFTSRIKGLPRRGQELIKVAACLGGSFDKRLLQASTSLSEQEIAKYLKAASEKDIIKQVDGQYMFSGDDAQKAAYALTVPGQRERLHAAIGRNLVRKLSQQELETHVSTVLLQFRRGLNDITNQSERYVIAGLCLRAVHYVVAASDFRAACNYSEFGMLLVGPDCWKDEYDLSLALYNASAEVFQCIGTYERVDSIVTVVLENARSYRDTLQVRTTRVHSLSTRYRMTEALEEALDVLRHLGERFPSKPRKYHVLFECLRTRRLIRRKTDETIMRTPLMDDADKIAALQILNLIFPIAYRTNPMLNGLFASRMVQITLRYGLSAISTVGFASFSSILAVLCKNKGDAHRCSQLALELLDRFDAREYIPRVYVFVYGEVFPYKRDLRELCTHLLQAYHIGLETGDIQFAMINATMFEGYLFFSGDLLEPIEVETAGFCEVAVSRKQVTALCLLRPELTSLRILMGKVERPTIPEMLKSDLAVANEANDKASACVIHFFQVVLAYIFGDFDTAAEEAQFMEEMLRLPYIQPGFSCLLVFHCLALLAVAPRYHGLACRKLLSAVKRSMKLLELFALSDVPKNCLHSLNLVQAELASLDSRYNVARVKYETSIALATKFDDRMIQAIAYERYAAFLSVQGDESYADENFRQAHSTFKEWGAAAKVQEMEKERPELISPE